MHQLGTLASNEHVSEVALAILDPLLVQPGDLMEEGCRHTAIDCAMNHHADACLAAALIRQYLGVLHVVTEQLGQRAELHDVFHHRQLGGQLHQLGLVGTVSLGPTIILNVVPVPSVLDSLGHVSTGAWVELRPCPGLDQLECLLLVERELLGQGVDHAAVEPHPVVLSLEQRADGIMHLLLIQLPQAGLSLEPREVRHHQPISILCILGTVRPHHLIRHMVIGVLQYLTTPGDLVQIIAVGTSAQLKVREVLKVMGRMLPQEVVHQHGIEQEAVGREAKVLAYHTHVVLDVVRYLGDLVILKDIR